VLVAPRRVVTCAHVIASALGTGEMSAPVPPGSRPMPQGPAGAVTIDFPHCADLPGSSTHTARVMPGGWYPGDMGDLALLEVPGSDPLPDAAPLRPAGEPVRQMISVFGHPAGLENGVWARAMLIGRRGGRTEWIQLDGLTSTGKRIQRGFSGAGVWDEQNEAVIGCVVASDRAELDKIAWMIPLEVILECWPELRSGLRRAPAVPVLRQVQRERDQSLMTDVDRERLAAMMYGLRGINDMATRDTFVRYITDAFGARLRVERGADGFHDTVALVNACLEHPGALHALVTRLREFHREGTDARLAEQIVELAAVADPAPLLTITERNRLYRLLDELAWHVTAYEVLTAFRACSRPMMHGTDNVNAFDLPSVIATLEAAAAVPGQLPPLIEFLEELRRLLPADVTGDLRTWTDEFAAREGIPRHLLSRLRLAAAPARDGAGDPLGSTASDPVTRLAEPRMTGYLLAELLPDGADALRYFSRMTLLHGDGGIPRGTVLHDGSVTMTIGEMPTLFDSVLAAAWEVPSVQIDELVIEFLLPFGMLGLPVDQWEVATDIVAHPVGVDHRVVVRCRDRRRNTYPHWREKSRLLKEGRGGVRWVDPDDTHDVGIQLYADLVGGGAPCLALIRPPALASSLGRDAVSIGLSTGVPVMVWCRDSATAAAFESRVRPFLDRYGIAGLQQFVQRLRRESVRYADPVGAHITLIWDPQDDRVLPVNRFQAPV
jgi:hypothetical protein